MAFIQNEINALAADRVRMGVFFNLQTDVPLRLWMGIGQIAVGVNVADSAGGIYQGLGQLTQIPEFQMLLNGQADRVEFKLSGISSDTMALVSGRASAIKNKPCWLGFMLFGGDWQSLGDVHWSRRGFGDVLRIEQETQIDLSSPITRVITLSVGSIMTGRRRRGNSYFTDQDQRRRSPGDRFCERVSYYSQNVSKAWPRF